MSPLEQLIMKKMQEGKKISPLEQKAKMENLDALKAEMHGMMKNHLQPDEASVEIASDSPKGLKEGMDKAQDVLEEMPESPMGEEEEAMEDESPAEEMMESSEGSLSPEEIDQLQMLLSKLKAKKS
jgi:hypothetical protein